MAAALVAVRLVALALVALRLVASTAAIAAEKAAEKTTRTIYFR
jgi:hypothetical protein